MVLKGSNTASEEELTDTLRQAESGEKAEKPFEGPEGGDKDAIRGDKASGSGDASGAKDGSSGAGAKGGSSAADAGKAGGKRFEGAIEWGSEEVGRFWEQCFPPMYNPYVMDGLHPKCLCSKICNDILKTNINVNSSSPNPNDRILCFEVLANLERKFIEMDVIKEPQPPRVNPPPGFTRPLQLEYKRVYAQDLNKLCAHLPAGPGALEAWSRKVVEESIKKLSGVGNGGN